MLIAANILFFTTVSPNPKNRTTNGTALRSKCRSFPFQQVFEVMPSSGCLVLPRRCLGRGRCPGAEARTLFTVRAGRRLHHYVDLKHGHLFGFVHHSSWLRPLYHRPSTNSSVDSQQPVQLMYQASTVTLKWAMLILWWNGQRSSADSAAAVTV